jgi:molecular chaperone HscA
MAKISINIATGSLQKDEVIVGIDLGTTNSLVAAIHPETKQAFALKEIDGSVLVPSVVYFKDDNTCIVGEEAKKYLTIEPDRTIYSAKRILGRRLNEVQQYSNRLGYKIIDNGDENSQLKIQVADKFYTAIDFSAQILSTLKSKAEHLLKTPVNKVVITVPAYFNDAQRQATRDAGKLAGLDVLRIINEPTAYGFGLSTAESKTIAVYDLGGGTFDVSILQLHGGVFEVLATNGDTFLGGDDFDQTIVDYFIEKNKIDTQKITAQNKQQLRLYAELAKKTLSTKTEYTATNTEFGQLEISKASFENLIQPIVEKTITCCKKAMKDAGLNVSQIDEVVMVGGSTRVPLVKQTVKAFFGKEVNDKVNPDEVVALGAAIQADILAGNNKQMLLLDVTPLSLGIETAGNLMDVLIPRNSKIPTSAAREYTTQVDGQVNMKISIYQGERDITTDNRLLDTFTLKNIPAMPAGMAKVKISFLINADGILSVKAKELRSGVEQVIEIKPQTGLDDGLLEKMLQDSLENAEADIAARALAEAKTEAEQLLKTTERFLQKNNAALIGNELQQTAFAMQNLQLALTMEDKNLIQQKTEELNSISRPYAERIMDAAIAANLKGKAI